MKFQKLIISGKRYNILFMPHNVPSSKNSRQFNIAQRRSFSSPAYSKYVKKTKEYWEDSNIISIFKNKLIVNQQVPYIIHFYFIRDSKRKFDWQNAVQGPLDLMVNYGWIEDDNASIMVPAPIKLAGSYYKVDIKKPGMYIIFE